MANSGHNDNCFYFLSLITLRSLSHAPVYNSNIAIEQNLNMLRLDR